MLIARQVVMGVGLYQRYLSPHKGYRCAYHAATGRHSCSRYAQLVIGRRGIWQGVLLLRRRFRRCAAAAAQFADRQETPPNGKMFGRCDPAVQEFRKLCCGGLLGGMLDGLGE
jgi:putative component of membrane protein insertase Oxa1/YidC/SpoIIIJ protein YidD